MWILRNLRWISRNLRWILQGVKRRGEETLKGRAHSLPGGSAECSKVGFFSEYWFRNALLHPNIRSESSRNSTERKTKPKSQDFELGNQYIS